MKPGWRLAGLGLLFLALFSVLSLRLWFLQVTQGLAFEEQVQRQQTKIVDVEAARGEILDRNGAVLAGTRASLAIIGDDSLVPEGPEREELVQRLATVLGVAPVEVRAAFTGAEPKQRFEIAKDVTQNQALFIREHAEDFPGIVVEEVPVRTYPQGTTAAHVLGFIGAPQDVDLDRPGILADDRVGRFGIERSYDDLLRGERGKRKFRVDATRDILSVVGTEPAIAGNTAILNLDLETQRVLEQALANGVALALEEGEPAIRAAGVVFDVRDGAVAAMASYPAFPPEVFIGPTSQDQLDALDPEYPDPVTGEARNVGVFNNFAVQGEFPPGSTFKLVSYIMALEDGIYPEGRRSPETDYFCAGQLVFFFDDGSPQEWNDWLSAGHGDINAHEAVHQSCDLYFWEIALEVWRSRDRPGGNEALIQEWARRFGFGSRTGIDLPNEKPGLVADRQWFEQQQQDNPGRVRSEGGWSGGDVMNIAIGQGLVTSTPLQLATAYAAMVNGGTLWRPRVLDRMVDEDGNVVFVNEPEALAEIDLDPRTVAFVKEDLRLVVNGPAGTARAAFDDLNAIIRSRIGGKTGTAEIFKDEDVDTAWFVGVTPIDDPEYVVVIVIDQGGSGGAIAAPATRQVLEFLTADEVLTPDLQPGEDVDG
jgi:penicillin-binding protein 2